MNDLSKRLRETLATGLYDDENGNPLTYHPAALIAIIREAKDALDARDAEIERLQAELTRATTPDMFWLSVDRYRGTTVHYLMNPCPERTIMTASNTSDEPTLEQLHHRLTEMLGESGALKGALDAIIEATCVSRSAPERDELKQEISEIIDDRYSVDVACIQGDVEGVERRRSFQRMQADIRALLSKQC